MHAPDHAGGVGRISVFPEMRLLHGAADFAEAGEFGDVQEAATQFLFRSGTTGRESHGGNQGECFGDSHKSFVCARRLARERKR